MERTVDGEKWVTRGWVSVLEVLYETDVVVSLSHMTVPENISEDGYEVVERLSSDSTLLTETELTENQAIIELNHLLDEGLIHYIKPFDDTDFVVYRLTEEGYQVAHDQHRTKKEDEWRSESRKIDIVLTLATGLLAATALIQAYLAYQEIQPPEQMWLLGGASVVFLFTFSLVIGRRGGRGPDLW
ncbi:hypothetical protein [Haloarchaeobius amylolyticus]|uniref:hypothetical protein n=1 Tax=Haloarchaeobius amylolyticus TaxID=1198296 RepID=UPI00226E0478|nr:hypothetical protein [Haloarchaeobius amylolyticus]